MTLAAISSSEGPSWSFSWAATSASSRLRGLARSSGAAARRARLFDQPVDELADLLHGNRHFAVLRQVDVAPIGEKRCLAPRDRRKQLVQMNLDGILFFLDGVHVLAEGEPAGHIHREPHQIGVDIQGCARQRRTPPTAAQSSGDLLEAGNELAHVARIQHVHHVLALTFPVRALRGEQPVRFDIDQDVLDLAPASQPLGPVAQQLLDDLGIRHDEDAGCGHPEHEQRAEPVGPPGNQAVQLLGLDFEGVAQQRKAPRAGQIVKRAQCLYFRGRFPTLRCHRFFQSYSPIL
jgi:hypothetical protein